MLDIKRFTRNDVDVIESTPVYQGFFKMLKVRFRYRLFGGGFSKVVDRELFSRGPASAVLLYDPIHQLVGLVEQFRVGALNEVGGPWLYEVIAGMIDEGSDPEATARKELVEEAGITDVQLLPICDYLVSPGGTDEKIFLFCGISNLQGAEGVFGLESESEDIHFHVIPELKVFAALAEGRINNAATTIALFWLQLHKSTLRS